MSAVCCCDCSCHRKGVTVTLGGYVGTAEELAAAIRDALRQGRDGKPPTS
jgi:hypothetical protein